MKPTVLIVEDEPALRDLFHSILDGTGCSILLAEDGEQALAIAEQAAKNSPFVLLTDIVLPGRNGHELAKEFLRRYPHTRIGFVTGWFDPDLVRIGICPDCTCILRKPFELSALRLFIDRVLMQPVCEQLFDGSTDRHAAGEGELPILEQDGRRVPPRSKNSPT